ncbi:IclR family transcriptional regulator [uncultured Piscinibacter sp.]|uniref:IclR family transcriptional regulator n=1 Tax=uncultured Piscinibacter sp. TaxID=1131835 RepID=UPI002621A9D8|nr:IclR family transcriptional regulator [uncultured Piscinibacter sp.]
MRLRSHDSVSPARAAPALVPAVSRALALLDRLAQRREPMSLARLASELELPKSSVHGLCSTLLRFGYLQRQDDGAFRIGPGVMPLAEAFVAGTGITQEFNALWMDAEPEETIILSVLNGRDVVYIAARNGRRPLGLAFNVGMRLPAHLAATGKAMLAFQPPETVRQRLGIAELAPMNRRGPASVDELLGELELTRRRGYSIDDEGVRAGVYCIGAPVFDAAAHPVAGIGVCLNKTTLGDEAVAAHRETVLRAASTLTQRLGGRQPQGQES